MLDKYRISGLCGMCNNKAVDYVTDTHTFIKACEECLKASLGNDYPVRLSNGAMLVKYYKRRRDK